MKAITRLFVVILIFEINFGCASKKEEYPLDFGFKVESEIDIINSFDSTYLLSYSEGDSIVKIQFSSAELKAIYNSIIKNKVDTYPDNYSPACEHYMIPSFETKLQFRINGKFKNLTYKHDCRYPLITGFFKNRKYAKIGKSIKRIEKIVYSKPEVKRLPDTDIIFL
jgi:hypothetical protein